MNQYNQYPEIADLLNNADHVDIKTIDGRVDLQEFLAGMFSYMPAWIKTLYAVRWGFVRLLGMKQEGIPQEQVYDPKEIPMEAGEDLTFFKVHQAQPDHYWVSYTSESHLTAYLAVYVEPLDSGENRFHMITIVHYNNWAGPVYFNVIRPFHHIVVGRMMRAGVQFQPLRTQYA